MIAIAIDIGTMTTGTPGATQSLRPTAPRIVDVAAIGKKRPSEKILSPDVAVSTCMGDRLGIPRAQAIAFAYERS